MEISFRLGGLTSQYEAASLEWYATHHCSDIELPMKLLEAALPRCGVSKMIMITFVLILRHLVG